MSGTHDDGIQPLWCGGAASDNSARGFLKPVCITPNLVTTNVWYVVTYSSSPPLFFLVLIRCLAGAQKRWWQAVPIVGSERYETAD